MTFYNRDHVTFIASNISFLVLRFFRLTGETMG